MAKKVRVIVMYTELTTSPRSLHVTRNPLLGITAFVKGPFADDARHGMLSFDVIFSIE